MSGYSKQGILVKAERLSKEDPDSAAKVIRAWLRRAWGPWKAAMVLLMLSTTTAAGIFRKLGSGEAERLLSEVARLEGSVPGMRERALTEFHRLMLARIFINQGGADYARAALRAALGTAGAG